ncbi:MAG: WYL domain-containing protein, partial [Acidimicrobiales bacterium]
DLLAALLDASQPRTRVDLQRLVPLYPEEEVAARRAFSRDVEVLARMGVPVEVADGQVPTYRVRREAYELPDPGLSEDEAAALHLALATVDLDLPEGSPAEALWKLTGGATERITAPAGATASLPGHEHLGELWAAVNGRQRLHFAYRGDVREVEPWQLSCQRGHWYLQGFDTGRDGKRLYRVDRIEGAVTPVGPPAAFDRPAGTGPAAPPPPWLLGDEVRYVARLWVDAGQAELVQAQGATEVEERRSDGSVVLAVPVANPEAFRSFALTLLDHAEVLGPPDARADVVRWLEATAR